MKDRKRMNEERTTIFSKIKRMVKDKVYDLQVAAYAKRSHKKTKNMDRAKRADLIFYIAIIALPIVQACIFYIGVNFNSFLLGFQEYNVETFKYEFKGLVNFKRIWDDITRQKTMLICLKNSLLAYAVTIGISLPLTLFFSYFIYKKMLGAGLFKVLLFVPQIIPSMILATMYLFFCNYSVPAMSEAVTGEKAVGLFSQGTGTMLAALLFFQVFTGFGSGVIMYSSTMGGIDESIVEAAKLDGANALQEFWHITLPLIFPTLSTFVTVGVAGIFTNQLGLFALFGASGDAYVECWTFGYFLYAKTVNAGPAMYPELSAYGLILTAVAVPLVYLMKFLLAKLGPSLD